MGNYKTDPVEEIVAAQEASLSLERDLQLFLSKKLTQIEPGLKLYKGGKGVFRQLLQ